MISPQMQVLILPVALILFCLVEIKKFLQMFHKNYEENKMQKTINCV